MKKISGFKHVYALSAVIFAVGCATGKRATRVDAISSLDIRTLSNGLRVVLVEDHRVPIVSYQSWFRVGSVDEPLNLIGSSHFFEHLMFKGTEKYGRKQFFEQLEVRGAEVNAFTTRDYTAFYVNATPDLLPKIIDMESDRLENLKITDEDLQAEQRVVIEERYMRVDSSPSAKMREALWQLAFRRHPYRWPVIGFPQTILTFKLERLQNFFRNYYHPNNMALVVVGDFDSDRVYRLIDERYGRLEGRKLPGRSFPPEPKQEAERRVLLKDHISSERLMQAYHITAASNDESYAIDVLSNILFSGKTSRVYRKVVEDLDLAATVSGTSFTPTFPGLLMISAVAKGKVRSSEIEKHIERAIRDVQENGVTEEEVRIAVRQLKIQLLDSIRTPFGLGQLIGTVEMVLGDASRYYDDLEKYENVRPEQVKEVCKKYLFPNNRTVVVMEPAAKKDRS